MLIIDIAGHIDGKTRMQKLVYLAQNKKNDYLFNYMNYLHGPFSSELSKTIDELKSNGFISEVVSVTPSGYQLYSYSLTKDGKSFLPVLQSINNSFYEWKQISDKVVSDYAELKLDDLLKIVYEMADLEWPPKNNH